MALIREFALDTLEKVYHAARDKGNKVNSERLFGDLQAQTDDGMVSVVKTYLFGKNWLDRVNEFEVSITAEGIDAVEGRHQDPTK